MNILSFDLEEWHLYSLYPKGGKDYYLPILDSYLDKLLDLLDLHQTKATFYCVAIIAREYPEVILKIANRGHEIGCHSDQHFLINELTPSLFRQDTRVAIDSLQQLIGTKVELYRAPSYSINRTWNWALEILMEEGITCDSSMFPTYKDSGFSIMNQSKPYLIHTNGMEMKEFPITYKQILYRNYIFSGGGFFRFFPYFLIKKWTKQLDYNMAYFHIRDFDKEQIRVISKRYLLSYYGVNSCFDKFGCLLDDYDFVSVNQAISKVDWNNATIIDL